MKYTPALALSSVLFSACAGESVASPASPPSFQVTTPTPGNPAAASFTPPNLPPASVLRSGALQLAGHLEGSLGGVELSTDTTDNSGSFELWENGGGYLQMNVAAPGTSAGAGMLILGIYASARNPALSAWHWSSVGSEPDADPGVFVSSCVGPVMGEWPVELQPVDVELTTEEDPEQTDSIVVVVAASFPLDASGTSVTTRLTGTIRVDARALAR